MEGYLPTVVVDEMLQEMSRHHSIIVIALLPAVLLLLVMETAVTSSMSVSSSEVTALINFKQASVRSDPNGFLANWFNSSLTPCSFNGVSCFADGRVAIVNLAGAGISGELQVRYLASLEGLGRVFLQRNDFSAGDLGTAPETPCAMEIVDISANNLSGNIPGRSFLSDCDRLVHVNLSRNLISGVSLRIISPSLLQLDLSHNYLSGNVTGLDFGNCTRLTLLDLSYNNLTGFPENLRNCNVLETLDLSHNEVKTEIPGDILDGLNGLKTLSLANNQFTDVILSWRCRNLQLRDLDLSSNNLSGFFPASFSECSSLRSLNLGHNRISVSGDFLGDACRNLGSLRYVNVSSNNIIGALRPPSSFCRELRVLDLSSNSLTGTISPEFCSSGFPALEKILLADNQLTGKLPPELGNCKNLKSVDFSFNSITGEIPAEILQLPEITELILWANELTGEIPAMVCEEGGNLEMLILNNNRLTGSIPFSISSCTNLLWLSLYSNKLTGEIPATIGELPRLAILQLGSNSLSGHIPPELGKCQSLIWLDLNSNRLSGEIPPELAAQTGHIMPGNVSGKEFMFVRNEGGAACRGAGGLVEFRGIRPERLRNFSVIQSCPMTRIYSGLTMYTFSGNGSMIYLDLSYNELSGIIPDSFGSLDYLHVMNLGHNDLSGEIPYSFGGLKTAGVLDLSYNRLTGAIPGSMVTLSFLSDLDLSNNRLAGEIPSGGQLTTFAPARFANNSGLCGLPLAPCGSESGNAVIRGRPARKMLPVVIPSVLFSIGLLLVVALYQLRKNHGGGDRTGEKYMETISGGDSISGGSWKISGVLEPLSVNVATFDKPLRKLTFGHLLEATNGFSAGSLIGSGGFGEVYKARLRDGSVVAIKKLIPVTGQGDREFTAEMETIGKIKHRNLVPLLGYCRVGDERLLVYEYMRWGSLECLLHDATRARVSKLVWTARKKIAMGAARGLAFLHHSCVPHIIHRDMKSSNVLLDEDLDARVSDFGMARLVNALETHLSVSTLAGTPGYVPPEYYQSFRCTTKGDVYSYGVVLLELLSGKKPIGSSEFGEDTNLVGWAKQMQRRNAEEMLDPEVRSDRADQAESVRYLNIAFQCLDDRPARRPTMIQVVTMFNALDGRSGETTS